MKKFMVLYMASSADFEKAMKGSTPEQQKKGMDGWMKWMEKNKKSIVEGGGPLGKTKRVDAKGTSNTRNGIGGYSVVQAASHDAAAKLFGKTHPHLQMMPGGWIEIVEVMPMPDM
jgi:YCII-related domain